MDVDQWIVVKTKPKQENRALYNLENQGYIVYLPMMHSKKKTPLFPGYLFVSYQREIHNIRSTLGVSGVVMFGSQIAAVDNKIILSLREKETETPSSNRKKNIQVGDRITIMSGPFKELEGVYSCRSGEERCIVFLDILAQNRSVCIPFEQVYLTG